MRRPAFPTQRPRPLWSLVPWLFWFSALLFSLLVAPFGPREPTVTLEAAQRSLRLPLEDYVCGVLAAEMPALAPEAALEAQAVAARTYAWDHGLTLRDSPAEQRYEDPGQLPAGPRRRLCAAAEATAGEVLSYRGRLALAVYSADAGPWSESSRQAFGRALPYLPAHPDPYGVATPGWHRVFWVSVQRWRAVVGTLRPRLWRDEAHHVLRAGQATGAFVASSLGLPSTDFVYRLFGPRVRIDTYGAGHGVGLDQEGAMRMGKLGFSYRDILRFYYPGTRVTVLPSD